MDKKVLFAGFEFLEKYHRGIYQYTKSLINGVSANGYETGILSQTVPKLEQALVSDIYRSLSHPQEASFPKKKKDIIRQYIKAKFFLTQEQCCENIDILTNEDFWFLKDVSFFVNYPAIYYMLQMQLRLPLLKSSYNLDLKSLTNKDLIFTTSPLNIASKKHKIIQTLHDVIPLRSHFHNESSSIFFKTLLSVSKAHKVLSVSEFSKKQFIEHFPLMEDKVEVVYQPIPTDDHTLYLSNLPVIQNSVLKKFGLKKGQYTYYVGAVEARKNIHRLIQAYQIATGNDLSIPLIISGGENEEYVKEYKLCKYLKPITESNLKVNMKSKQMSLFSRKNKSYDGVNIFKTNYVTELEKLCLIRNAKAFLFPTLNEGFGIPVLEAQTLGTPVLTTNCSSIPEVVGDTAYLINDPFNIEEIAHGIQLLLEDDELCQDLSKRGLKNAERFSKENFKKNIGEFLEGI